MLIGMQHCCRSSRTHLPGVATVTRKRTRAQSGSAMVEAAWILMPFLALCLAMLDYPFSIFIQNTLRNAVREGVRYGITQQTCCGSQDTAISNVVIANSAGFLTAADISASRSAVTIQYFDGKTLAAATGTGSNAQGNICVVTASVQRGWMAPLWRAAGLVSFSASSSDVMEAPPNGALPTR